LVILSLGLASCCVHKVLWWNKNVMVVCHWHLTWEANLLWLSLYVSLIWSASDGWVHSFYLVKEICIFVCVCIRACTCTLSLVVWMCLYSCYSPWSLTTPSLPFFFAYNFNVCGFCVILNFQFCLHIQKHRTSPFRQYLPNHQRVLLEFAHDSNSGLWNCCLCLVNLFYKRNFKISHIFGITIEQGSY
jgi:hypothetical protein